MPSNGDEGNVGGDAAASSPLRVFDPKVLNSVGLTKKNESAGGGIFVDPGSPLPPRGKVFRSALVSNFGSDPALGHSRKRRRTQSHPTSKKLFDSSATSMYEKYAPLEMKPSPSGLPSKEAAESPLFASDDMQTLSREELIARVKSLQAELDVGKGGESGTVETSPASSGPATTASKSLSPAMYSVSSQHSVRRSRLIGRSASFHTQEELAAAPVKQREPIFERLNAMFRPSFDRRYFKSQNFADVMLQLCARMTTALCAEPRVLELASPVYVFGDLHGNFDDLKWFADHVFPLGMQLTAGTFLFLGDFVDRGEYGLEVLAYLWAQKLQHNTKLYMLRGNHETRAVNGWEDYYKEGSFLNQCKRRFGRDRGELIWEECNKVFDCLPLATIIDNEVFCVHGGIPRPGNFLSTSSAGVVTDGRVDAIRALPCPIDIQPPTPGVTDSLNDLAFTLLWADPANEEQEYTDVDAKTGFGDSARGGGTIIFGNKAVQTFLDMNSYKYIMRAHEATQQGVGVAKHARVLTVFSTSKDHGCGMNAQCGCVLVDKSRLLAINRSVEYMSTPRTQGPKFKWPTHMQMRRRLSSDDGTDYGENEEEEEEEDEEEEEEGSEDIDGDDDDDDEDDS